MKKRYTVSATKYDSWFNITDNKKEKSFWMHISDFGIVRTYLPAYCTKEAGKLFKAANQGPTL